jgi:hypothetical protein
MSIDPFGTITASDIRGRAVSGEFNLTAGMPMTTQPITVAWKSFVSTAADAVALPATFSTPQGAWAYGAATDLIETDVAAEVVLQVEALAGKIGLSLLSEDYSSLASEERMVTPADGKTKVTLTFNPNKSPARILVRNYGDGGNAGQARVDSASLTLKA